MVVEGDRLGILVMAYGTPKDKGDILRYYTDIRRGRPPSPELLAELEARYEAIGGASPLAAITAQQAHGLAREVARRHPERAVRAYVGMRHSPPFIPEAVRRMAEDGLRHGVGLVLAPHYSSMSVGAYLAEAEAARPPQLALRYVRDWHLLPSYIEFLARRVTAELAHFPPAERRRVTVVFTAHSLPERIRAVGDPYPEALAETAAAVAEVAALPAYTVAWQSAGRTEEPWLGPDLLDVLTALAADRAAGVVVCPCGFVSDHLEILYDLDIEARAHAERLGLPFRRTAMGNADPDFVAVLADAVETVLAPDR
jgi:ferrochelatase